MAATQQPLDAVELSPTTTTAAVATTTMLGRYRLLTPTLVDLARFVQENTSGIESSIARLIAPLASPFDSPTRMTEKAPSARIFFF